MDVEFSHRQTSISEAAVFSSMVSKGIEKAALSQYPNSSSSNSPRWAKDSEQPSDPNSNESNMEETSEIKVSSRQTERNAI